ncbi:SDR family NAD(P)-dependent oxidoreductase [Allorhizobium sp. BGMRC 0089]|uniref:SDR family NAD(P)-dependent oxidoreductase n=1 Tax=Allorhizobium sonneratiae TaxID=2934936 RepID=UPI0020334E57|nr:SDR family NAD(P)-dependent oxidoreductase [Allorhizobium sonneratiae]MCM2293965.1 SDR family NAD(P)-dependent oxidoreductase [Allorhizobium sonneratiae]
MTLPKGIVWITGASSGIGMALAERMARDGHVVAISARRVDDLQALADRSAGRIHAFPLDITDRNGVHAVVDAIERTLGPIGIAVLSAGSYLREKPERFDADQLRQMVELNIMGTGHCLEALIPRMVERKSGAISMVGSVSGYTGLPGGGIYGGTKSALITLAEAMAPGLKRKGVAISVINPGFVKTPLTDKNDFPMPFIISAEQAADHIVRGLAAGRFDIAFPWQIVWLLKLLRRLPYPLYFALTQRMLRRPKS